MKNRFVTLGFLSIVVLFILHAIFLAVPAEDSFISFRFAKNLAEGYILVWNIGELPVEGFTNFLWVLICTLGTIAGFNIILFAQFFGITASIFTIFYVYKISRQIGFDQSTALLPCLFLAVSGPFATWASSGMETNLFTFFLVGSAYHSISFWKSGKNKSLSVSFLFCFLATLTRPEGFGIFLLLLFSHIIFYLKKEKPGRNKKPLIVGALVYLVPFIIYFTWRYTYFGFVLPLTFYAKTGGTLHQWFRGLKYLIYFSLHFILPFLPLLLYLFWKKKEMLKIKKFSLSEWLGLPLSNHSFSLMFCGVFCSAYILYIILVGGDYMAMYRFFVPVLPFIYILLTAGFNLMKNSGQTISNNSLAVIFILIALIGTLLQSTPLEKVLFHKPGITHGQYQGVLTERWHSNRLTLIGKFFNEYKKSDDESLATDAIGAISFYSDLKVYDFHGLVDPVIARMEFEDLGKGFPGHEKINLLYTLSKQPIYFIFSREFSNEPADYPSYSPKVNKVLLEEYMLVSKWFKDEKNNEEGYFTFLQRKDKSNLN
jgi:arabinofuranosyltransferase